MGVATLARRKSCLNVLFSKAKFCFSISFGAIGAAEEEHGEIIREAPESIRNVSLLHGTKKIVWNGHGYRQSH